MFRPTIKVLDCTIRDGGLMNNHYFEEDFVRAVYGACAAAGVDYMELGYKCSPSIISPDEYGAWKFCEEETLRRIVGENDTDLKLSVMCDIGRIEDHDILPADESVIDMIRVACYVHQVDKAVALSHHCMDKGYEVTVNLMAVSRAMERDLNEALGDLAKSRVDTLYIVDSFGAMYCEQVDALAKKYHEALPGRRIGFHGHNNQQLAFANTIEAIIQNCDILDGSMLGIGRGAGNCPLELLMSFLKNPKFDLRPILDVIAKKLVPLQKEIDWGYYIPYLITGVMNEHPRNAMKWMKSKQRFDFVKFYDKIVDGEELE